jgi:hypothetical protein
MMSDSHSEKSSYSSTEQAKQEQGFFTDSSFLENCFPFINASEDEGNEIDTYTIP